MLPGERTVTVVDRNGMPVWWPNLFHAYELRNAGRSYATQKRTMSAIVAAFNWAEGRDIDIEARIASFEYLDYADTKSLQALLKLNVASERKGSRRAVGNGYWDARCRGVRDYVRWRAGEAMQRLMRPEAPDAPAMLYRMAGDGLERFEETLLSGIGNDNETETMGLDESQRASLLEAIVPGSPTNPFEKRHQFRNFALILSIYEMGARNGETLGLKREDLHLYGDAPSIEIHRRHNDPKDPRSRPPATKTKARLLPISAALADVLGTWLTDHRSNVSVYPNAGPCPYVFLSERGRPIASNTVERIFVALRKVEGIPPWLTAHKLRHTFNDRFSELIDTLPEDVLRPAIEARMRNFLNGWSPTSEQGENYRRRFVRTKAHELLSKLQNLSALGAARS
ncbi:hypothetical protein GCM10007887_10310 [Methylobacterium haplocladii]|uniref:Tyr recombinase domain-containing protein n=2 Tax=Methylobacterium haplocladii TaxID=1176176 RepID=A0A512IN97_9HYPH|nr:hypothetical protein MHA02_15000 [Methylobacterium haplocladii]GLS58371.1 hypothetical protein GCM10007887_10310 [Methylobacterium haplocladii]